MSDAATHPLPPIERLVELLMNAARTGRDEMIPALLQAGVGIDTCDSKGFTALILASYNGWESATKVLLDLGAATDVGDGARGNTALMGVAFKGYGAIAAELIAAGADVNVRNHVGQTALMMAALFGHTAIVQRLLAAGAELEIRDEAGNSALALAKAQGNEEMTALLLAHDPT